MKTSRSLLPASLAVASMALSSSVFAAPLQPIPQESGFGGSLILGLSGTSYSSNMVAGPNGDLGNASISSLDSGPDSEGELSPFLTGEVAYTFGKSRTQLFLGNALEDLVRYDLAFQAGVRQELADKSIVYGAFLFSAIPTEVYADPYQTGTDRDETDRESTGGRIGWQGIMGSGLGIELSHRSIELDDEESGQAMVDQTILSTDEQALLNREGDQNSITLSYKMNIDRGQFLVPELSFHDFDLDGEAMARQRYGLTTTYFLHTPAYSWVVSVFYAHTEHEEENPIYGITEESDSFGGSVVGTYHNLFGWQDFSAIGSVAYGETDSDINFYDADVVTGSVGILYRF